MRWMCSMLTLTLALNAWGDSPRFVDVFTSGQDGYHMYRIPAVVVTNTGALLAFAEGRKVSGKDNGDIDLLVKRSTDGGQTWSKQTLIWDDGDATCGNPCPVVDRSTGTIWLAMNHNVNGYVTRRDKIDMGTRTVWLTRSDDDGLTWAAPTDITPIAKESTWTWHGVGPGVGIQLERGEHPGRLLLPCYYNDPTGTPPTGRACALYSDDHGRTWQRSDRPIMPHVGENQFVELADGRVMANLRCAQPDARRRVAISEDGGATWGSAEPDVQLLEPRCQGSILRYTWPEDGRKSRILFSNPATEKNRDHLVVRLSFDEGATWPVSRLIYEGGAAYSCLVALPDGRIGCFFERDRYRTMTLAIFTLDWLTATPEQDHATATNE